MKRLLVFWILVTLTCFVSAKPMLFFSTVQSSVQGLIYKDVLTKAYSKIGFDITVTPYPALRGIELAKRGELDGEAGRLKQTAEHHSSLLMIPVPIFNNKLVAFVKDDNIKIKNWDDMLPYRVTTLHGLGYAKKKLTNHPDAHFTQTFQKSFSLLNKGRYDIVIATSYDGLNIINQLELTGFHIFPIESAISYHLISNKHKDLLPAITTSLQEMKSSGEIDEISHKYMASLKAGQYYPPLTNK